MNSKKILLAVAIASFAGLDISGAIAEDRLNKKVEAPIESRAVVPDRNITNPNIEGYTSTEEPATEGAIVQSADVDHEGVVHFEPNSVSLTQQGEGQLKQLVEQLDKDKPVALTIDMRDYDTTRGEPMSTQRPQSVEGSKDSSAGYPAENEAMTSRSGTAQADSELENRAELIANYRVESIRLYLLEKGVEVVEWNLEGQPSKFSGTRSVDSPVSSVTPTGPKDPQTGQIQDLEDVQQVRIVVVGEISLDGLSAL